MSNKMADLTLTDIKAAIALEERNIAVGLTEVTYSEEKLKLLYAELAKRNQGEKDKSNG